MLFDTISRRSFAIHWLLLLSGLFLFGGTIAYLFVIDRIATESMERDRLLSHARIVMENLEKQLIGTDNALLGIRDACGHLDSKIAIPADVNKMLSIMSRSLTGVKAFRVTDPEGLVRFANQDELIGHNLAERDFFLFARAHPDPDRLFLSAPYMTSLGIWSMNLVRVLLDRNGVFAGIAVATLDPDYFITLLGSVNYSRDMWSAIAHSDGLQFIMVPEREGQAGKNLAQPGSLFSRYRESGKSEDVLIGTVYATGEERMMANTTIAASSALPLDKSLVIAVTRDLAAITAGWRKDAIGATIAYTATFLLSILILSLFHRRQIVYLRQKAEAEANLKQSEEKTRLILESAGEGIYGIDITGTCTICNPACLRILGYSDASALLGKNMHALVHHSHADNSPYPVEECRIYQAFLKGEGVHVDDEVMWRADGTSFPVEYWSYPQTKDGKIVGGVVAFVDITERKIILENLELAARVFEGSFEGIMITRKDGTIIGVNEAFTNITGFEKDEILGQKPNLFKSDRHPKEFFAGMWEALFKKGQWSGEIWDRKKNGEIFQKWLSIGSVRDSRGEITHFVAIFTDITSIKQSEEKLQQMAHYDFLTGLPNRVLFLDRLTQAMRQAERDHSKVGLMFIDLDGFKKINDSLGHKAGDDLLIEVAQRLKACVRKTDTASRLGGDEFTVVLTEAHSLDFLAKLAAKLAKSLSRPIPLGETQASVTASIGISVYPTDGTSPEELIKYADTAMYNAKQQGKNNFQFYSIGLIGAPGEAK